MTDWFAQKFELSSAHLFSNISAEKAPTAVVNLIGRKQYARCAKDIFYFSQVHALQTFNFASANVDRVFE